ncbi:MAG TPA: hypothetical protein VIM56_11295 [Rhizomicrobium sp.]
MLTPDLVRKLNDEGCRLFEQFVIAAKADPKIEPPFELLQDDRYSAPLSVEIPVSRREFKSRYELGAYLNTILAPLSARQFSRDQGLWNWLALYFFNQLWTPKKDGSRSLGEIARYVLPAEYNYNKYYRQLVREAWNFVRMHGELARVALTSPLHVRGEIAEQLASRQWTAGNSAILEAAGRLFIDAGGNSKRGVAGKGRPGTARRLSDVVQQFDRTYDLSACDADKVLELLPAEFDEWRPGHASGTSESKSPPLAAQGG